jgi:hypothetical protein
MSRKRSLKSYPFSGDQPNGRALAVRQDAEAIVLDFMNPAGAARGLFRRPREARFKTGLGLFSAQSALQLTRGGHRWGKNSRRTQTKGALSIGNEVADGAWLVRAVNGVFAASKRHGGYAHRVTRRAARDYIRQVRFVMPYDRRW